MRILLLAIGAYCAFALPTRSKRAEDIGYNEALDYFTQFNYMGENSPDPSMASLTTVEQYNEALCHFQRMWGLPETCILDEATKTLMGYPRCGLPDFYDRGSIGSRKRRYLIEGGKWQRNSLTYKIDNYTPDMTSNDVNDEIRRAFNVWSDNSGLQFTQVYSGNADILIKFAAGEHGDGNPFDGPSGTLAHAYFPNYGGDAHFDEDESYTMNTYSGINLFQVAAHEFGHSLGLGHSNDQDALMAPFYRGYQPNFQLHSDDISGIQVLYGMNTNGNNPTTTTTTAAAPSTTTTTTQSPVVPGVEYCDDGRFDAITNTHDGSTYGFRGNYYYKITGTGVAEGYPKRISDDWQNLSGNIDAAIYWPQFSAWERCGSSWCYVTNPGATYFMKDNYVYKFVDQTYHWRSYISDWISGLPNNIDAAFVWKKNGRSYFFKDGQYYRTDTGRNSSIHANYPKDISVWWTYSDQQFQDTLTHIDAAVQYTNGRSYFFQGENYYRFNDNEFKIDDGYPRSVAYWWYGCRTSGNLDTEGMAGDTDDGLLGPVPDVEVEDGSSGVSTTATLTLLTTCVSICLALLL